MWRNQWHTYSFFRWLRYHTAILMKGVKITMKIGSIVKIGLCCAFGMILVGCNEYQGSPSQFGTGRFYCYYHDERNGQFYEGVADEQDLAVRNARNNCLAAPPKNI